MFKREVEGNEIEFVLEERAYAEIDERHPDFVEWLADDPRTVKVVAAMLSRHETEGLLLLSMMKNDYISRRKYQADALEHEEIADQLREPAHDY